MLQLYLNGGKSEIGLANRFSRTSLGTTGKNCSLMRIAAKVHLGPNRSQAAPAVSRTIRVAVRAAMFELAIWSWVRLRSFLMVTVNNGGNAYQDQKATKNDHHERRKTLP